MKKSEFIKKVLKSPKNTVFVNKEQVENALEVFQRLDMAPPANLEKSFRILKNGEMTYEVREWEPEDEA